MYYKGELKCKKGLCVNWSIVILVDFGMFYALSQMNFRSYSCFIKMILVGIIVLNFILLNKLPQGSLFFLKIYLSLL